MKTFLFLGLILLLSACMNGAPPDRVAGQPSTPVIRDTIPADKLPTEKVAVPPAKTYKNARFRAVRVEQTGEHRFRITGQGQIFEASFSWVVEDGHEELKQGFQMTDAGAPAWGNFDFTLEVSKKRPNSTLLLILFESSAKDGSRQHELPVVLY